MSSAFETAGGTGLFAIAIDTLLSAVEKLALAAKASSMDNALDGRLVNPAGNAGPKNAGTA